MIALGIDPGKSGALAAMYMDSNKKITDIAIAPFEELTYRDVLSDCVGKDIVCCVEKVGARPGQGVVSMFNFGRNFGIIEGMLIALQLPYQLVTPQAWKKEFSLTGNKQTSIDVCKKLFPGINLLATERSRKEHDGMAEALLMAEYARRRM